MGRFFSNELFHFVGRSDPQNHEANFAVLEKILSSKCVSHPPHEPGWSTTSIHINWVETLSTEGTSGSGLLYCINNALAASRLVQLFLACMNFRILQARLKFCDRNLRGDLKYARFLGFGFGSDKHQ